MRAAPILAPLLMLLAGACAPRLVPPAEIGFIGTDGPRMIDGYYPRGSPYEGMRPVAFADARCQLYRDASPRRAFNPSRIVYDTVFCRFRAQLRRESDGQTIWIGRAGTFQPARDGGYEEVLIIGGRR